jgi:hypothetical protein
MMKFSDELNLFLLQLHADSFDFGRSEEQIIQWALDGLDQRERKALKDFLVKLLVGPIEPDDLQRQWSASQADIHFGDAKEIPAFLKMVHDLIE